MHCSGQENPADIPSRGLTPQELADSQLWTNGPSWLKEGEFNSLPDLQMPEDCRAEMKKAEVTHGLLVATEPSGIDQLIRCEDFSSLHRLLSVTAKVLKFCQILLRKIRHNGVVNATPDNCAEGEILWIVKSQQMMERDKNFSQWRRQLGLFQDENQIWQCRGLI